MERTNLDGLPPVTQDEALEFMAHHLQIACVYFQNVADSAEPRAELERIVSRDEYRGNPHVPAIMAFYDTIFAAYDQMKKDDAE